MAGMLEADLVHGYSDGTLKPKGNITRQELAQVLYNALDCITDDPDALTGTRCLYTGPASALEGRRYDGDLIVSSQDKGELTLENLDVTGRLVLHLPEAERAVIGTGAEPVSNVLRRRGSDVVEANAVDHGLQLRFVFLRHDVAVIAHHHTDGLVVADGIVDQRLYPGNFALGAEEDGLIVGKVVDGVHRHPVGLIFIRQGLLERLEGILVEEGHAFNNVRHHRHEAFVSGIVAQQVEIDAPLRHELIHLLQIDAVFRQRGVVRGHVAGEHRTVRGDVEAHAQLIQTDVHGVGGVDGKGQQRRDQDKQHGFALHVHSSLCFR